MEKPIVVMLRGTPPFAIVTASLSEFRQMHGLTIHTDLEGGEWGIQKADENSILRCGQPCNFHHHESEKHITVFDSDDHNHICKYSMNLLDLTKQQICLCLGMT